MLRMIEMIAYWSSIKVHVRPTSANREQSAHCDRADRALAVADALVCAAGARALRAGAGAGVMDAVVRASQRARCRCESRLMRGSRCAYQTGPSELRRPQSRPRRERQWSRPDSSGDPS